MKINNIPLGSTAWSTVERTEHPGSSNHWCSKGHILLGLEDALHTGLEHGQVHMLLPGMGYQVADGAEAHRSAAPNGAKLFIVD